MTGRKQLKLWICLFCVSVGAIGALQYHHIHESVTAATIYSWGSRGNVVRQIQQKLKNWGYLDGNVDGVFGQATWEAVRDFQRANGLTVDGIAGTSTLEAMGIFDTSGSTSGGTSSGSSGSGVTGNVANATEEELRILASAIYGEGRGEPYEGQVAIGAVILNRVRSANFPNSIAGVVYQRGAFDAVADGQINLEPNDTAYRAANDALNGWDPTDGALYYWNPATATSRWIWTVPITTRIGRHVFGTK